MSTSLFLCPSIHVLLSSSNLSICSLAKFNYEKLQGTVFCVYSPGLKSTSQQSEWIGGGWRNHSGKLRPIMLSISPQKGGTDKTQKTEPQLKSGEYCGCSQMIALALSSHVLQVPRSGNPTTWIPIWALSLSSYLIGYSIYLWKMINMSKRSLGGMTFCTGSW